jgi:putative transposase
MKDYRRLNHTKWDCKYHVVFIPKKRKKKIFGALRKHLGDVFHELAVQKESKIEEGHLHLDHVHAHVHQYSSKVLGFQRGRLHQG